MFFYSTGNIKKYLAFPDAILLTTDRLVANYLKREKYFPTKKIRMLYLATLGN